MSFSDFALTENLEFLKNEINCEIVKNLKRTKNPSKTFKLKINEKTKIHLSKKYNLDSRYRQNNRFLEDYAVVIKRYMQLNSFCFVEENSFQIRLSNNRKVNFNEVENGNLIKGTLFEGPSISVRFNCGYRVELSEELKEWSNGF
jgi:beta-N-acetylglucosaminidase